MLSLSRIVKKLMGKVNNSSITPLDDGMWSFVGHIQVLDEALVSLYRYDENDYYMAIRLYEEDVDESWLFVMTSPTFVIAYIEDLFGLHTILLDMPCYYYVNDGELTFDKLKQIDNEEAFKLFNKYAAVKHRFSKEMAYKTVSLKQHLKKQIK